MQHWLRNGRLVLPSGSTFVKVFTGAPQQQLQPRLKLRHACSVIWRYSACPGPWLLKLLGLERCGFNYYKLRVPYRIDGLSAGRLWWGTGWLWKLDLEAEIGQALRDSGAEHVLR